MQIPQFTMAPVNGTPFSFKHTAPVKVFNLIFLKIKRAFPELHHQVDYNLYFIAVA